MGDEADSDWESGLVEWGEEDTRRWEAEKLEAAARRMDARARSRRRRAAQLRGER